jgi:hypothetical protein
MSKRQQWWLGFGLVCAVVVGVFAVAWAAEDFEYALQLFMGLGVIGTAGMMLIGGLMLMLDAKDKREQE